jgi:hypothetical protein
MSQNDSRFLSRFFLAETGSFIGQNRDRKVFEGAANFKDIGKEAIGSRVAGCYEGCQL